jgi:hypothetical protein
VAVEDELAWSARFRVVLLAPGDLLKLTKKADAIDFRTPAMKEVVAQQEGVADGVVLVDPTNVLLYPRRLSSPRRRPRTRQRPPQRYVG